MGDNFEVVTHDDSSSDEPNSEQEPTASIKREVTSPDSKNTGVGAPEVPTASIKREVASPGSQNTGVGASEGAAPPARNGLKRARLALHDTEAAPVEEAKEFKDVETQTESDAEKELKKRAQVPFPPKEKNFVVKRRLMNVERMTEDARVGTRFVEHFGTLWNFSIFRNKNHLAIRISNDSSGVTHGNGQWSIKLGYDVTMKSGSSCEKNVSGTHKFGSHGDSESCFLHPKFVSVGKVAGLTLDFELRITILSMSGFYAKNLTEFDVSVAETSDAILVVNDRKFFVSRLFLARQSSYFKTMFLGPYAGAKMPEITLFGVDPEDMQKYLEVLHGENAIDDINVEALILLAKMYDSPQISRKCVEYLQKTSRKPLKTIFEIAMRYPLEALRKTVLNECRNHWNIREVVPENLEDLDHSVLAILLEKALANR